MVPARTPNEPDTHEQASTRYPSRRSVLATTAAAGTAALSGCVRQLQSVLGLEDPNQVSLSIKTMPTDSDPRAIRIGRFLSKQLEAAGASAQVVPMSEEELLRDVLLNSDFDIYVARFPAQADPDFLRPLLHSRYNVEPGWQNPFGYASYEMDDLLERQRVQQGGKRLRTLHEIQRRVVRDCPFTVVAFQDELRLARGDRFAGWGAAPVHSVRSYLSLRDASTSSTPSVPSETVTPTTTPSGSEPLRMATADARMTENLNPLSAEFREDGTVVDLLYDPLGRWFDGTVEPWLAADWSWQRDGAGSGPVVQVALREDLTWHDGEDLTAADVAFTYRFLRDTSLGTLENPVPAPRYRGLSSLVTAVTAVDDRTVRLRFRQSSRNVAARALTAPVLPRHVWSERTDKVSVTGRNMNGTVTDALVWSNTSPVGSGPFRFEKATPAKALHLSPFEDHFLRSIDTDADPGSDGAGTDAATVRLTPYAGDLPYDALRFVVVPSGDVATEFVARGKVDGTASSVMIDALPQEGLPEAVQRHVDRPPAFYHVGFNVRRAPLGNPRFRHVVSRLLDRGYLVEDAFEGNATPATSPLARHEALAPALAWGEGEPELPFVGERGRLNAGQVRDLFREAGYRYGDDGNLLGE